MKNSDVDDLKILIENVDIFKILPDKIKEKLADAFSLAEFPEETPIIFQNQAGEAFYLVSSGQLEVLVTESGSTNKVASMVRGEYFGEMSLLTGAKATATVKTITPVRLFRLSRDAFGSLIMNQAEICDLLASVLEKRKTDTELIKRRLKLQPVPDKKENLSGKIKKFLGLGK